MKKFSLLKSLDEVILPFILLFWARYLGVFITGLVAPIEFTFSREVSYVSLPFIQFSHTDDLLTANSISWILTGGVLAITFGFIAFRNLHLNEDWLHPRQAGYLHHKKMDHFIISSYESLHQGISWLAVAMIAFALATTDLWFGVVSTLAYGVVLAVSAALMLLFALSLEQDTKLESKKVQKKKHQAHPN